MAHEVGHTYGAADCAGCYDTIMYNVISGDSYTSPQCCDAQLLYNASGAYGQSECGEGGGCSDGYGWCLTTGNCPGGQSCGVDSGYGCCNSTDGGGGGDCIGLDHECDPDDDNCCEPYSCTEASICEDLDPIIFDLTGHGYQLTNVAAGVKFDFYGNGTPQQMSWTAEGWDGGFLALDRNRNGKIDNASELFSNLTPQPSTPGKVGNGFLALAIYDLPANGGNGDGWIDEKDAIFSKLVVWVDKNHNGVSEPGELLTMKQAGIKAISLKYSLSKWKDAFGNTFRYSAQSRTSTSPNQVVYDVLLQTGAKAKPATAATKQ